MPKSPGARPTTIDSSPSTGILGEPMFKGSIVALVTPMARDGALDQSAFGALLDRHLTHGTDGLVIGGTTGESPTLAAEELELLLRDARTTVHDRIPAFLVAAEGRCSRLAFNRHGKHDTAPPRNRSRADRLAMAQ